MLNLFILAISIALIAISYRNILAYENILNWWFRFGSKFENRFFYKPIWGCVKCISGQIALWFYLLSWLHNSYFYKNTFLSDVFLFLYPRGNEMNYNLFGAIFLIFTTILITNVLDKFYNKVMQ